MFEIHQFLINIISAIEIEIFKKLIQTDVIILDVLKLNFTSYY